MNILGLGVLLKVLEWGTNFDLEMWWMYVFLSILEANRLHSNIKFHSILISHQKDKKSMFWNLRKIS